MGLMLAGLPLSAQEGPPVKRKLPAWRTPAEQDLAAQRAKAGAVISFGKTGSLPAGIRFPGEFEECQAVLMAWSLEYDAAGNVTGVDTAGAYAEVSARLAAEIQKVVPVIIRVPFHSDTNVVRSFMAGRGTPLLNAVFCVQPGDEWWMRDYGPLGVYYGAGDSLAFIDLNYYEGRDADDLFAAAWAGQAGKPVFRSSLYAEGGNLVSDGLGSLFFSNVITAVNGSALYRSPVWTSAQTLDTLAALLGGNRLFNLSRLNCDGGTGHIDLYLKMIDEQTLVVSKYPDEVTARDKQIIEDNLLYIASHNSTYNRPYRVYRIPHPTDDHGAHSRQTCGQLSADARTFVNGLTINDTYIMPSYSDGMGGNTAQTEEVKALFRSLMPGYRVVDIDARSLSPLGGEIHCLTMQVPAENPVLFWHPSVDGFYPEVQTRFHIVARITNRSGIASARCMWRLKGEASFRGFDLADSSGYLTGDIDTGPLTGTDEIEYYLTATTNNGKTASKPMNAASGGFYNIRFRFRSGIDACRVQPKDHLFSVFPNPASDHMLLSFYATGEKKAAITITDMAGKKVKSFSTMAHPGLNELNINLDELNNGIYFYTYTTDGNVIATRRFMINK